MVLTTLKFLYFLNICFTFEHLLRNVDNVIVLDCESKNWLDIDYEFPSHLKLLGLTLKVSQNSLNLLISLKGSYKIVLTKRSRKIERSTIRTTRYYVYDPTPISALP